MFDNPADKIIAEQETERISKDSFIIILTEITHHMDEKSFLRNQAQSHGLAGIYNRKAFFDLGQKLLD